MNTIVNTFYIFLIATRSSSSLVICGYFYRQTIFGLNKITIDMKPILVMFVQEVKCILNYYLKRKNFVNFVDYID